MIKYWLEMFATVVMNLTIHPHKFNLVPKAAILLASTMNQELWLRTKQEVP